MEENGLSLRLWTLNIEVLSNLFKFLHLPLKGQLAAYPNNHIFISFLALLASTLERIQDTFGGGVDMI